MCHERAFYCWPALMGVVLAHTPSLVSAGLPWSARAADFPEVSKVARIEVSLSSNVPLVDQERPSVEQRERIAKVLAILANYREGWKRVWVTPPAGQVALHFESASTKTVWPLCTIRLGKGWVTTDIDGHCYWRAMSEEDQNYLLQSIGLDGRVLERVEDRRPSP